MRLALPEQQSAQRSRIWYPSGRTLSPRPSPCSSGGVGLPPASTSLLRQASGGVLSPPHGQMAPRGAQWGQFRLSYPRRGRARAARQEWTRLDFRAAFLDGVVSVEAVSKRMNQRGDEAGLHGQLQERVRLAFRDSGSGGRRKVPRRPSCSPWMAASSAPIPDADVNRTVNDKWVFPAAQAQRLPRPEHPLFPVAVETS
jgi:hypothetical protein